MYMFMNIKIQKYVKINYLLCLKKTKYLKNNNNYNNKENII